MKTIHKVLKTDILKKPYLENVCLASAGPDASVKEMRKIWGQDAYIIRLRRFIYLVKEGDYNYFADHPYKPIKKGPHLLLFI